MGLLSAILGIFAGLAVHLAGRAAVAKLLGLEGWVGGGRTLWRRLLVPVGGLAGTWLLAAGVMAFAYVRGGMPTANERLVVAEVVEGMPAARAGVAPGDVLLAVDAQPVRDTAEIARQVDRGGGNPVVLDLRRDGAPLSRTVTPTRREGRLRIGLITQADREWRPVPPSRALLAGARFPADDTVVIFQAYSDILFGRARPEFAGPVGIVRIIVKQRETDRAAAIATVDLHTGLWLAAIGLLIALFARARKLT
jgi:regulator of sigma E protease